VGAVERPSDAPRALEQVRRTRTTKPPDQRRREILQAALELFRDRGFEATAVQAIAERADVAAGTVYLYFPSKDAILLALAEEFEAGLVDRFAATSEQVLAEEDASGDLVGYEEVVDRLLDAFVRYSLDHRAVAEIVSRQLGRLACARDGAILGGALTNLLADVIRAGERLGYVHTSDPTVTAYLLTVAVMTAIGHALAFEDEVMLHRVVRQAKELFIKALAPPSQDDRPGRAPARAK
jgi:AcrR family transcriptional regulator